MEPFIIGTAGHVDHGKTTLIKALTGTDADRLKEEKARGMTIELGYAYKEFSDGICLSFVDVPGHEKLVKTMVSGAAGMDLGLLIVDAKEGVMPQTEEHLQILRLLDIKELVVAVTKVDLVSEEQLVTVKEEIAMFLSDTPYSLARIIPVSAKTGEGIADLEKCLYQYGKNFTRRESSKDFRMSIDRVFSLTGHGTVVTGTIKDGMIKENDQVRIYTAKGEIASKAKSLQVHYHKVEQAVVGQRLALLLNNVAKDAVKPGDVLIKDSTTVQTDWIDALIENTSGDRIKHNQVIRLHIGTKEVQGKIRMMGSDIIQPGEEGYASIRLVESIIAKRGDKFIIRKMSPMITLGGGRVLSNQPAFKKRHTQQTLDYFSIYAGDNLDAIVVDLLQRRAFMTNEDISSFMNEEKSLIHDTLDKLEKHGIIKGIGNGFMLSSIFNESSLKLKQIIMKWYTNNKYALYIPKETLRSQGKMVMALPVLESCLNEGINQGGWYSINHMLAYNLEERKAKINRDKKVQTVRQAIKEGRYVGKTLAELEGLRINPQDQKAIIEFLNLTHDIVAIHEGRYVSSSYVKQFLKQLRQLYKTNERVTVVQVKEFTRLSRKPTILLLEYCDEMGYTKRDGNERIGCGI